jgi:superoxide dismutase, Fe-Mn family
MNVSIQALHVASLGDGEMPMEPAMALALTAGFGSVERWRETFMAISQAHAVAAGWVCLSFLPSAGRLVNQWLAEDDDGTGATGTPILALRPADAPAAIDWPAVYLRYQTAVTATSEDCGATQDETASAPLLLDVRRAGVFEKAATMIPGARWCDPATVGEWAATLDPAREVVVYCVYGHEVGRTTAMRLRAAGLNARYLRGGIDAWQSAGKALAPKGDASPGGG